VSISALAVSCAPTDTWFSAHLRRRLHTYRAALTEAWSESTAHPDFGLRPDAPASAGQCGVSSAWLLGKLPWPLRACSRYCVGDVIADQQTLPFHCWIEVGHPASAQRVVVDLTCDQFEPLADRAVVCDRHRDLVDAAIDYRAAERLSARQLRYDPVWDRAQVLAEAMRVSS
jgi:hypothetical protein